MMKNIIKKLEVNSEMVISTCFETALVKEHQFEFPNKNLTLKSGYDDSRDSFLGKQTKRIIFNDSKKSITFYYFTDFFNDVKL